MSKWAALILLIGILAVIAVSALSGCADKPVYIDRPVEVMVPVPVKCLSPGDIPPPSIYPVDQLTRHDSDGDVVGALLADHDQRDKTEALLRGIIDACTTETP